MSTNNRLLCSKIVVYYVIFMINIVRCLIVDECLDIDRIDNHKLLALTKLVIPALEGKTKGDAGKIGVIGGSTEYTGAPYFAAETALKIGADLVYVITTETAAPVIKTYSPDLIVYPFLNKNDSHKMMKLLSKMDVIVIGPGLGREKDTLTLFYEIIEHCKIIQKPLVIDADGLYAISQNITSIKNYPSPGIILTPNHKEEKKLKESVNYSKEWYSYWGSNVAVLVKGQEDRFYSATTNFSWSLSEGGSGRRAGGQGDILSGCLGTFINWVLKTSICEKKNSLQLSQTIATFAAAIFTRECNFNAFKLHGRSMTASDMLSEIHFTFDSLFL